MAESGSHHRPVFLFLKVKKTFKSKKVKETFKSKKVKRWEVERPRSTTQSKHLIVLAKQVAKPGA